MSGDLQQLSTTTLSPLSGFRANVAEKTERMAFSIENHIVVTLIHQHNGEHVGKNAFVFASGLKAQKRLGALFLPTFAEMFAAVHGAWKNGKGALLMRRGLKADKRLGGVAGSPSERRQDPHNGKEVCVRLANNRHDGAHVLTSLGERNFEAFSKDERGSHLRLAQMAKSARHRPLPRPKIAVFERER